jgi:hypothetical protein
LASERRQLGREAPQARDERSRFALPVRTGRGTREGLERPQCIGVPRELHE